MTRNGFRASLFIGDLLELTHSLRGVAINLIVGIPISPRTKGATTANFELIEVPFI